MTIQSVALQLLGYIGIFSLDPDENTNEQNQRGLQPGDKESAIAAINGALQEIYSDGPVALSEKRLASVLYPPTSVTLALTQYSAVIGSVTGWQSWMAGCTIQMSSGDAFDNEFASQTALLRPFMGATGTVSGTVYCDSLRLPANLKNVMEPIEIPNVCNVRVASSRDDFRYWNMANRYSDHDMPGVLGQAAYLTTNKTNGEPRVYLVEAVTDPVSQALPLYLRLNPMPARAMPITYRARLKPPVLTVADIGDADTEPSTVIPSDWIESILLPMARKRFMSHPSFSNRDAAGEIMEQYRMAKLELASFQPGIAVPDAQYITLHG